ncbi:hypothetical protein ACFV4P_02835 [Kitasatospora sp. NPDC059795]|uniref:hypothetical protein n=1 Tax=Kitasatospora sp. NPDC059795 TaxID=3346949 RepID=UPI003649ED70
MLLPDAVAPYHLTVQGLAEFTRGGRPALPTADDGNGWVDGLCWLYCGQWTRIMWIGPVTVAGATAPMYACADCIRRLNDLVWAHLLRREAENIRAKTPALAVDGPPVPDTPSGSRCPASRRRFALDRWRRRGLHRAGR